jgi:DNA-binding MarR family transcriptional regulator
MTDIRDVLCQEKHFMCLPDPLLTYLCSLRLKSSELAVYLIHWGAGRINRNWESQLTLSLVARKASYSEATVKRAYSALVKAGLIRRTRTGRNITTTEVLIPRAAEAQLRAQPNRAGAKTEKQLPVSPKQADSNRDASLETDSSNQPPVLHTDNGAEQPIELSKPIATNIASELAQKLLDSVGEPEALRLWHEMLWSMSHGAYKDSHPRKQLNSVLKLHRENRWSRPNDMPKDWQWKQGKFPASNSYRSKCQAGDALSRRPGHIERVIADSTQPQA